MGDGRFGPMLLLLPVTLQCQLCPKEGPGVFASFASHRALPSCRPAASLPSSSPPLLAPMSSMHVLPLETRPATWLPSRRTRGEGGFVAGRERVQVALVSLSPKGEGAGQAATLPANSGVCCWL